MNPLSDTDLGPDLFRSMLDAAPDAMVVVDPLGRIVFANDQTERLFGHPRADLRGQEIELLIPGRLRERHAAHRGAYLDNAHVRPMGSGLELSGVHKDGSEFAIEISLSPVPSGAATFVCASIRDISDRKRSEERVLRIQAHLLSAVESIQGAVGIFDAEDRLVLCNSTYRELLGPAPIGEFVGRSFEELLDASLEAGLFDLLGATTDDFRARVVAYHRAPCLALDLKSREGRSLRIVERRTAEAGTVLTIGDVTEDFEHERELREARAAAEAANAAKSEFLSSMSHELRTPLNAILGFAQLLQRDKKSPLSQRHQERIDPVIKGGEHLLRLVDDILDLSRIEAGLIAVSPEPITLTDVLTEVKTTLEPMAARAGIRLVVEQVPSECPAALADRTRSSQILMNFVSNAIKYGRRGGVVTLVTACGDGPIRVSVLDDGIGIPADKQDKIFQPFQRAGQERGPIQGTGIGLAISRRLAEIMDGAVGFRSTEGVGSEFWLDVPRHQPESMPAVSPADEAVVESPLSSLPSESFLVVYVEDNPANIAFMKEFISDFESIELVTAPTAEIGIELVRARKPHVVLMDINLPGMSGFEATRRLSEWPETRDIPVVALSAAAMVRDKARVEEAGFYRYLEKPVKLDELSSVLEDVLLRTPVLNPAPK